MPRKTIVVAWVSLDGLRKTDRFERFDGYNYRPVFEPCEQAHACVWLLSGDAGDLRRALDHVETSHPEALRRAVYTFPEDEPDPLGRAKSLILGGSPGCRRKVSGAGFGA